MVAQVANGDPLSAEFASAIADATGLFSDFFRLDVPGTGFTLTEGVRIDALASAHEAAPLQWLGDALGIAAAGVGPVC